MSNTTILLTINNLLNTDLISCTRHLTVRSCFMTSANHNSKETEVAGDECDGEHHHDDNCDECKKKLHGALVDSLPPSVMLGQMLFTFI